MIQQARFLEIHCQLDQRIGALLGGEIVAFGEFLMDTYCAIHFAAPTKQTAERELQLDRLGIRFGDFNE